MLYAIVAVIVLILDQAMKYWTNVNLQLHETAELIPGVFQLARVHNTGAAWGLFQDSAAGRWIFVGLALVVTIVIVVILSRGIIKGALGRWSLVFIIAGALGNAIDRAVNGYVVDMFQFPFKFPLIGDFPVFNVADIFITVFGIAFCIYVILHKEEEEEEARPEPARPARRPAPRQAEPVVHTDYITQLKKPVVEGKKNIEREIRLKSEAAAPKQTDTVITDWNEFFEDSSAAPAAKEPPKTAPAREPAKRETPRRPAPAPAKPAGQPETARRPAPAPSREASSLFQELQDNPVIVPPTAPAASGERAAAKAAPAPPAPKKKGDAEFDLDDILAEFRDK